MAAINDTSWMTTFIYRQDLRSYYMNNLLYSVIHPGIYNQGISLFTSSTTDTSTDTESTSTGVNVLRLKIRKGTTFIFSNDYTIANSDSNYERNFSNKGIGSNNENVVLIKCTAFNDVDTSFTNFDILNTNETLYLIAYIKYDANNNEDYNTVPQYAIYKKRNTSNTSPQQNSTTETSESYFYPVYPESGEEIPDGKTSLSSKNKKFLYVILGVIEPSKLSISSNVVAGSSYDESWFKTHIFTNKGLPDYRYQLASAKSVPNISVMVTSDNEVSRVYVDWKDVSINGDLYSSEVDWKEIYGLVDTNSTMLINNISKGVSLELTDTEISKIKSDNKNVVLDFIFAKISDYYNSDDTTLNFIGKELSNIDSLPLMNYRYIGSLSKESKDEDINGFKHYYPESEHYFILPLDEEPIEQDGSYVTNRYRLTKYLKNNKVLKKVLNNIRKEKLVEGIDTLIPVALAYRYLSYSEEGITSLDGFTSEKTVNPMNVLNLLSFANENVYCNVVSNTVDSLYRVLPVIE